MRASGPVLADSLDLSLNPMPTGATLLAPGEPAPKDNARASAYGCYLASRPYSDEVAFHSKYLHFPESVVEEAGPATRQVAWSREARLEANASTDAVGVRYMNCVIPDTDEAEQLAREQILEAGFEDATYEAVQDNEASSKTTCEMITVVEVTCAGPSDGPLETCTFEENTYLFCHDGGGSGSGPGDFPDPGDGPGGGDPGDGDPGEGNECTIDNPDPGSDCEPLDPCDGSNPPEACENDEDEEPCVPSLSDLESIFENAETEIVEDVHEAIEENISEFDIGGVAGALLIGVGYGFAGDVWDVTLVAWPHILAASAAIAVTRQCGDLIQSLLKRTANQKDAGGLLPGHGGFFDRFDAMAIAGPVAVLYLHWIAL